MKKTYRPRFSSTIFLLIITISSSFFSLYLFSSWKESGSLFYLICAILFLFVFVFFSKPILEWRIIEIENDTLIIFRRFFKPLRINIAESLYQVIFIGDHIRSFRFKRGEYHLAQISPILCENGDDMAKTLSEYIKKHKLPVDVVVK
jgi:hypothetical protein